VIRQALDELKHQIPLLDYLQSHHWQPTGRLSRGRWMGLCPLHQDRKPSFVVDTCKNLFYCYGCGRGGDVIRFAELYHQVRFPQALGLLCQWRVKLTERPLEQRRTSGGNGEGKGGQEGRLEGRRSPRYRLRCAPIRMASCRVGLQAK